MRGLPFLVLAAAAAVSCGGSDSDDDASGTAATSDDASSTGAGASTGAGGEAAGGQGPGGGGVGGGDGCHADGGPADKPRFLVVGHPYDTASGADGSYEVLTLASSGDIESTGRRFTMGRAADRAIVFTPDGRLGFAVQDDGSIGAFEIDATGAVSVRDEGYRAGFYAESLTMSADGGTLWVVDINFPENGGGVYEVAIACDGALGTGGRLFEAKSAEALLPLPSGGAVLAARGAFGSTAIAHAHRVTLSPPALGQSVDVFGDDDAILSSAALTHDGKFALLGDNSSFSGVPNRVGVVAVTGDGIETRQLLPDIEDPYSIAASPFDDVAIVASGFGDAILVLDYDPAAATPFSLRGELEYAAGGPQLPGSLAQLARGPLEGRVFVTDVRGLFVVGFQPGAVVEDVGLLDLGGGEENIVSGVGVQP